MPYLIRRPGARRLVLTVICALSLAAAAPAAASACAINTSGQSQVFASIGDYNWYTFAPGGSFTSGAPGWTLNNASAFSGGSGTNSYLTISAGGSATSAPFCVSNATPYFRFYARKTNGNSWGSMNVNVIWTNTSGQRQVTGIGNLGPSTSWTLSTAWGLGAILPTASGATFTVQLQFDPLAGGSSVRLADVYIDPYRQS
jgi:hypothetical protein